MDKYFKALDKYKYQLMNCKNVVGIGVGYKYRNNECTNKPSFIVFVEKKEKVEDLSRGDIIPRNLGGLVTDVLETGKFRLLGARNERYRPAMPGVSIGHYKISAGTFGAVVRDKNTGEPLILSNNHILANGTNGKDGRAKTGDPVLQPGGCDPSLKKSQKLVTGTYFWLFIRVI